MKKREKGTSGVWIWVSLAVLLVFLIFLLYPLVLILYKSFVDQGTAQVTLSNFARFFAKKFYWVNILHSFKVTLTATIISVLIGLPMAYLTRMYKIKNISLINILCIIAYLSPPFIGAYAWIQLLGRNGIITRLLSSAFHMHYGGIYGFAGIVLVMSMQSFPLVFMYISGAMKNMDSSLSEAAESLGSSGLKRFFTVIVPLVMPSLLAGALLVFARVFADFGTPMLIGEGYKTMPVLIYNSFMSEVGGDDGFAAALCVIAIIVVGVIFIAQKIAGNIFSYSMTALRPIQQRKLHGISNGVTHLFVYLLTFIAILPQIVVIVTSFLKNRGGQVFLPGFSLQSYRNILGSGQAYVIRNTYLFGLAAIILIIVFGVLVAYMAKRKRNALTGALDTISMLPYIIPGSVLGISFIFAFNAPPIMISGTAIIIIISLMMRRLAYTIRSSSAIIAQISPSMEEAAISLGSGEFKAFADVTLPMMLPGVISGALMSWITVISELSSSVILYTSGTKTLTVAIYTEVIRGNYGNAAAFSTVLTLTSVISLLLFFKLSGRKEISI